MHEKSGQTPSPKSRRTIYGTSPVKRIRRSQAQCDELLSAITEIVSNEQGRITIRHLFYRLVGLRALEKTEAGYKGLCQHLSKWRRSGDVPWDSFADNTRWHIGTQTFDDLNAALQNTLICYRRNLWAAQSVHLEIWTEKDAISGILHEEADTWGVKVFTCRGFASLTSLYNASETFKAAAANGKTVMIYYFGDHDPSGLDIDRSAAQSFAEDFGVKVQLVRVAVTPEQIIQHNLPTRPVKTSDRRSAGWEGGCVEIDTLLPAVLRGLVRSCISEHIEPHAWEHTKRVEEAEREILRRMVGGMGGMAA